MSSATNNTNNTDHQSNGNGNGNDSTGMTIHLLAGAVAGTTGAVLTCPLEVVKTRFQASTSAYQRAVMQQMPMAHHKFANGITTTRSFTTSQHPYPLRPPLPPPPPPSSFTYNNNKPPVLTTNLFRNTHLNKQQGLQMQRQRDSIKRALLQQQVEAKVAVCRPPTAAKVIESTNKVPVATTSTVAASTGLHRPWRLAVPGYRIYLHAKFIVNNEGIKALFKGLGPTIFGVAPYRAIYFYSYASVKQALLNSERQPFVEGHPLLHVTSAACAGFTSVTVTNPVWFVKTRLQLDESRDGSRAFHVIRKIWREKGLFGFYKGITASYFGVTETALYFAIYEQLKRLNQPAFVEDADYFTFLTYFTSAGFSKSMAACVCYPHEVARTRLRQEGTKYRGFFQTLALVFREEGTRGLYKGLATHLVRQIPNTAIVMTTYELVLNYVQTRGIVSGDNGNDNIEDGE